MRGKCHVQFTPVLPTTQQAVSYCVGTNTHKHTLHQRYRLAVKFWPVKANKKVIILVLVLELLDRLPVKRFKVCQPTYLLCCYTHTDWCGKLIPHFSRYLAKNAERKNVSERCYFPKRLFF